MDPRLLQYYERELGHLSEMGAEFAQQFPKIAARLGMSGLEVADPYVERLLEGAAFLAARVQLKLDAEFPRFTQSLLEIVYPHYLAPTPSMLVAQMHPDKDDPGLASGTRTVPRGTMLHSIVGPDDATACEFRTAHDVTLLPLEVASASYFSFAPDLPLNTLPIAQRIKGGLRIRLKTTAGLNFAQTRIDRLCFYLAGRDDVANRLLELCSRDRSRRAGAPDRVAAPPTSRCCRRLRFGRSGSRTNEALLPVSVRSFQGYRLLQEYFTFPQRYRFIELAGLAPSLSRVAGQRDRAGGALRARRRHARERRRRLVSAAVLHAGGEPLREAAHRSDSRERLDVRVPRRRGSHAASGFRDLPGHRRHRPWCGRRQRTAVPAVLFVGGQRHRAPPAGVFHDAARAARDSAGPEAARTAIELHRQRSVPVAGRFDAGSVFRGSAAALDPGAVHQPRSGAAHADRARRRAISR